MMMLVMMKIMMIMMMLVMMIWKTETASVNNLRASRCELLVPTVQQTQLHTYKLSSSSSTFRLTSSSSTFKLTSSSSSQHSNHPHHHQPSNRQHHHQTLLNAIDPIQHEFSNKIDLFQVEFVNFQEGLFSQKITIFDDKFGDSETDILLMTM